VYDDASRPHLRRRDAIEIEAGLVILLLCGVTLPLWIHSARGRSLPRKLLFGAAWIAAVGVVSWCSATYGPVVRASQPITDRPIEVAHAGYVSSRACRACHPEEYASWHRSYHRTMTQPANTGTVLSPIDGVVVQSRGRPFALERRGRSVWVEMDDPDHMDEIDAAGKIAESPRVWREIVQTTGSHNEQFYWISSGDGRKLTLLPIMYRLLDERRWASLDGCCISEPNAIQESSHGRWNRVCNRCHATHALPGIDADEGTMDTRVAELGIACEACHGPAAEHIERYRDPRARYARHARDARDTHTEIDASESALADAIVNPAKLPKERSAEVCGQCHGIHVFRDDADRDEWRKNGFRYRPGDVLADSLPLAETGVDRFWSDGTVRVSGREYNGLVKSPCFERGEMTCLSCHSMHRSGDDPRPLEQWSDDQLRVGMDGDRACTQCHARFEAPEAVTAHTHHAGGSTGSACMNCHMPYTTYGLLKGIRCHRVTSPSVRESVDTGRPNACNQCHLDRTLAWSAAALERWYGIRTPALDAEQRSIAASVLWTLEGDAGQRALMAWSMSWSAARKASGTDWMTPFLTVLAQDPYRAVRFMAYRSLARQPDGSSVGAGDPLAPQSEHAARMRPVLQAWSARRRAAAPELLITEKGEIDLAAVQRFLAKRDERAVVLNE
jgi:hypothetical protein